MKKFLGKLGRGLLKGTVIAAGIATGYGPLIAQFIPGKKDDAIVAAVSSELQQIAGLAVQVEVFNQALTSPLPGPEKLNALVPLVTPLVMSALGVTQRKQIDDPVAFDAAVKQIASGVVDAINAVKPDAIPDAA